MIHVFIVNPTAGRSSCDRWLKEKLANAFSDAPELCEVYLTAGPGDATELVVRRCQQRRDGEELCFYGCGGDGTLNEVAAGVLPYPFASLGIVPCGTGNDYIKNFPGHDFLDMSAQRNGYIRTVDIIRCNGRVVLNICNAGLDANVARDIVFFKQLPLCAGPMAYIASLCKNFFSHMGQGGVVVCDGKEVSRGELLLVVAACGGFYGGGFNGAPHAQVDDGLMDLVTVPKLTRPQILSVLPRYKKGLHTTDRDLRELVTYNQCRRVSVTYDSPVTLCIDGETTITQTVEAAVIPGALRVWLPMPMSCVPAKEAAVTS